MPARGDPPKSPEWGRHVARFERVEDYEIRVPRQGEHYEHYRGGRYEVLAVGRLSEARDQLVVVYRSLERGHVWVRPLGMWGQYVELPAIAPGKQPVRMQRFVLAADSPPSAEVIALSEEEVEELDRELAAEITLTDPKSLTRQRCQHLRSSAKIASYATIRVVTTPDRAGTVVWDYRVELELCGFCIGYITPLLSALRAEPILCAEPVKPEKS